MPVAVTTIAMIKVRAATSWAMLLASGSAALGWPSGDTARDDATWEDTTSKDDIALEMVVSFVIKR